MFLQICNDLEPYMTGRDSWMRDAIPVRKRVAVAIHWLASGDLLFGISPASCGAAVDGSHIEVKAPSEGHTDYFNRKGYHSVVLQAVVDHRSRERNLVSPDCLNVDISMVPNIVSTCCVLHNICEMFDEEAQESPQPIRTWFCE
ncbi:hypothetical protein Bbelb_282670 [Branchiostoma belcheri]|nr:hypothetical protein Bbelb_282670 [Branchiostoma belcheri]